MRTATIRQFAIGFAAICGLSLVIACGDDAGVIQDDREFFESQSRQRLEDIDRQIDILEPQLIAANDDAAADLEGQLATLKEDRDKVADKIEQMARSDDESWDGAKDEIASSLNSIERRLDDLDTKT